MKEQGAELLSWTDFAKVDMRVGTILEASIFKEARKPAYKIVIDFGPLGTRKTSAQITKLYDPAILIGQQVVAVVNFPAKQIANMQSECLILCTLGEEQTITLLKPERKVPNVLKVG